MPSHPIVSSSERLILRPLEAKDAEALYRYRNQPDVMEFQGWTPASAQEVVDYAAEMHAREIAAPGHWYQVILQVKPENEDANAIIGDVAFCIEEETQQQAELGIALDTQFQKRGYAQEAVKALVDYLFETYKLHRIHVSIDPANAPSLKLLERIGFRLEGHLKQAVFFKGQWCDDVIMAILGSEWHQK